MKHLIRTLPLVVSLSVLSACAGDFQSSNASSAGTQSDSSGDTFSQTQQQINNQMATDAANAAAQQQFLQGMADAQQTMNNANAEYNQNGLH